MHSEQEAIAIAVTKLLLGSYYVIVRKNIEDIVPKAIMHFLVSAFYFSFFGVLNWYLVKSILLKTSMDNIFYTC